MSIREKIKQITGKDLNISGGPGNRLDNAIVIHHSTPNNYVEKEYIILGALIEQRGAEYELVSQSFFDDGEKKYDTLRVCVSTGPSMDDDVEIEDFYFDITECFGLP